MAVLARQIAKKPRLRWCDPQALTRFTPHRRSSPDQRQVDALQLIMQRDGLIDRAITTLINLHRYRACTIPGAIANELCIRRCDGNP